ncbi:glycosyltransferase family 8 protein [Scytonema sp. NUACC26]|uniref:glycosyltransferase family 8 protein n=1 Tax=Scytonema sp. NUACC26 TaxID=3140176 RepID=UPI0034DBFBA7
MSVKSENQPIVLICAADNNYAMPLAVTVCSAVANLKNNREIALFILDGGISEFNKRKITKSLNSSQVSISWIKPDDILFENIVLTRHLTVTCYYRLLVAEFLPKNFDKAIYLDTDMVVTGDLSELWDIDLKDNYVLAVQDDVELFIGTSDGLRNYREIGLSPEDKYFNSGLLVINLEKWRAENIGQKVIEYVKQNSKYVRNDQDALNAVLAGKWGELHPKWNVMPKVYDYQSWQESPFTLEVYDELYQHPAVIHYTNSPKPWYAGLKAECKHPKKNLFFQYVDLTAWSGYRDTLWRRLWRKFMKVTSLTQAKL